MVQQLGTRVANTILRIEFIEPLGSPYETTFLTNPSALLVPGSLPVHTQPANSLQQDKPAQPPA